jgi:hypothetical protein
MTTFKERFCERFRCSRGKYEATSVPESAYPHAQGLIWFTSRKCSLWEDDVAPMRDLGDATDFHEVIMEDDYRILEARLKELLAESERLRKREAELLKEIERLDRAQSARQETDSES